jgi:dolichol-phosphate mannosyltransferase
VTASGEPRRSLAVVIPMYNEEAGAEACVGAVCGVLKALPVRTRLIVVNDGSSDRTRATLERLAPAEAGLEVVHHEVNAGYGAALRTGVEAAHRGGFDYVLFMDSDLTNSPDDIPRFLEHMDRGADVIKATRYRLGGAMRGVAIGRQIVSRSGGLVARLLFHCGVSDCTNGFRAVRTTVLMRMRLQEPRFPVIVEELYCCLFLASRFAEVPVVLTGRDASLRPTSFAYRPSVFWRYLKYAVLACLRVRPTGRIIVDERGRP